MTYKRNEADNSVRNRKSEKYILLPSRGCVHFLPPVRDSFHSWLQSRLYRCCHGLHHVFPLHIKPKSLRKSSVPFLSLSLLLLFLLLRRLSLRVFPRTRLGGILPCRLRPIRYPGSTALPPRSRYFYSSLGHVNITCGNEFHPYHSKIAWLTVFFFFLGSIFWSKWLPAFRQISTWKIWFQLIQKDF
jgi:hypothetical protein